MNLKEAHLALSAGADLLGFVSEMPSGPGIITLDEIRRIVKQLPAETKTVLLTSERIASRIIGQHERVQSWAIQLTDSLPQSELRKLRTALSAVKLIQVLHVQGPDVFTGLDQAERDVDFILLDSGQPNAPIKTLGGTGLTHDWNISREVCRRSNKPVFLAGGLNTENIANALDLVRPYGVDVCSGVRAGGVLDREKLGSFIHRARSMNRAS